MRKIERLLVVEDDPKDMLQAAETARGLGIGTIEGKTTSESARARLEKGLRGELSLPDAIVLDLDLGMETGHDLLRFWYMDHRLSSIPLIVWSWLGEDHQVVCEAFKVKAFVSKHDGIFALRQTLETLAS
jgi:CheY-like chemotaxis protein